MANCGGDCTSVNSANLNWFKIAETGLVSGSLTTGDWGTARVMKDLKYTTTIPSCIPAGNYLIRHELLALHQANTPQCEHLRKEAMDSAI
jgi:hypothetical protein